MDLQLAGKRALVTGSTGGIGEAIARLLAREGAAVAIHGRNKERAERVAEAIRAEGGTALVALGDLNDDAAAEAAAQTALEGLGGVDILVNNAAGYDMAPWQDTTPDKWARMFNEDLFSVVRVTRAVLPAMRASGWGRIINIASAVGTAPFPMGPDYSAVKAALMNLTVSLSKDLAGTGITSNTVSPGAIHTPNLETFLRSMAGPMGWGEEWAGIEAGFVKNMVNNPTGRVGTMEEVAAVVAFLASPLSSYVNGANYRVDGGTTPTVN